MLNGTIARLAGTATPDSIDIAWEARMAALEQQLVTFLHQLFVTMNWGGVVLIMILESANIPIPSEVTMPLAGWFLAEAQGKSMVYAILAGGFFGALGCTIGSVISYALGAYGGRPFLNRYGRYLLITHHDLEKADHWFERWGNWAVFISRLLPIVRTFISFPAGVVRISFIPFTVYTFVGSFIWCGALALGGYMFGARWEELRAIMRPFDIPIAVIIGLAAVWYIYHHIKSFRAANNSPSPENCD
jgi:membrane protein DedA with SNARE-associated domain